MSTKQFLRSSGSRAFLRLGKSGIPAGKVQGFLRLQWERATENFQDSSRENFGSSQLLIPRFLYCHPPPKKIQYLIQGNSKKSGVFFGFLGSRSSKQSWIPIPQFPLATGNWNFPMDNTSKRLKGQERESRAFLQPFPTLFQPGMKTQQQSWGENIPEFWKLSGKDSRSTSLGCSWS